MPSPFLVLTTPFLGERLLGEMFPVSVSCIPPDESLADLVLPLDEATPDPFLLDP